MAKKLKCWKKKKINKFLTEYSCKGEKVGINRLSKSASKIFGYQARVGGTKLYDKKFKSIKSAEKYARSYMKELK